MKLIRVLVADDHAVVRKGIQMIVSTEPSIELVSEAEDGANAVYRAKECRPDVILMDLVMPVKNGIDAAREIKQILPEIKIIVLTTFEDEFLLKAAMQAGVDGYILKDADDEALLRAIHNVQRGEMPLHPRIARKLVKNATNRVASNNTEHLTSREKDVLDLVAKGLSNKDVAQALHLSEGTVKIHVSNILGKLNVSTRTEAAVRATQMGLVPAEEDYT